MAELKTEASARPHADRDRNCEFLADSREDPSSRVEEEGVGLDSRRDDVRKDEQLDLERASVAPGASDAEEDKNVEVVRRVDGPGIDQKEGERRLHGEKKVEDDLNEGEKNIQDDGSEEEKKLEDEREKKIQEEKKLEDEGEKKIQEEEEKVEDDRSEREKKIQDEQEKKIEDDRNEGEKKLQDDGSEEEKKLDEKLQDDLEIAGSQEEMSMEAAGDPTKPKILRTFERRKKPMKVFERRKKKVDGEASGGNEDSEKKEAIDAEKKKLKRPRPDDGEDTKLAQEGKVAKKPKEGKQRNLKEKLREEKQSTSKEQSKEGKLKNVKQTKKLLKCQSDGSKKESGDANGLSSERKRTQDSEKKKVEKKRSSDADIKDTKQAKKNKASKETTEKQDILKEQLKEGKKETLKEGKKEKLKEGLKEKEKEKWNDVKIKDRPNLFRSQSNDSKKEAKVSTSKESSDGKRPEVEDAKKPLKTLHVEPEALNNALEAISTPVSRLLDGGGSNKVREAYEAAKELKQRRLALKEETASASMKFLKAAAESKQQTQSDSPVFKEPTPDNTSPAEKEKHGSDAKKLKEREKGIALETFQGMLETLTRAKESIQKTTLFAMDCANKGIAKQVMDAIMRKLKREREHKKRVDLLFLVDSMAQYHHHKGGPDYASIVEGCLARFLTAVAPPNSPSENRQQCVKVVNLWVKRNIMKETLLKDTIARLGMEAGLNTTQRQYQRHDRAFHDPMREMGSDMLVDEYGSNTSFQLPGFLVRRDDEEDEEMEMEMEIGMDVSPVKDHKLQVAMEEAAEPQNGRTLMVKRGVERLAPLPTSPPPSPPPLPAMPPPSPPRPPNSPPPPYPSTTIQQTWQQHRRQ
ncbi:hypothetical protein SELMODRAFT_447505 [Selaginella moellendorffii]|uniref:CID domain-containing protein n=1 Tax=Selaginella moellendorffii TaxID=88036 RepID=D8T006_SELML|nr:ENHANCER OF AG-4 protein 2 [Selaginella moellendorffii]EFJ09937.1 hypothetical protein SELMODRAFT_447505 [Selaginella moellendorffii]|eukprot:XP_024518480.1 ENHANCER OF AG-4 protein 2 [Selaginella moellendorffii]